MSKVNVDLRSMVLNGQVLVYEFDSRRPCGMCKCCQILEHDRKSSYKCGIDKSTQVNITIELDFDRSRQGKMLEDKSSQISTIQNVAISGLVMPKVNSKQFENSYYSMQNLQTDNKLEGSQLQCEEVQRDQSTDTTRMKVNTNSPRIAVVNNNNLQTLQTYQKPLIDGAQPQCVKRAVPVNLINSSFTNESLTKNTDSHLQTFQNQLTGENKLQFGNVTDIKTKDRLLTVLNCSVPTLQAYKKETQYQDIVASTTVKIKHGITSSAMQSVLHTNSNNVEQDVHSLIYKNREENTSTHAIVSDNVWVNPDRKTDNVIKKLNESEHDHENSERKRINYLNGTENKQVNSYDIDHSYHKIQENGRLTSQLVVGQPSLSEFDRNSFLSLNKEHLSDMSNSGELGIDIEDSVTNSITPSLISDGNSYAYTYTISNSEERNSTNKETKIEQLNHCRRDGIIFNSAKESCKYSILKNWKCKVCFKQFTRRDKYQEHLRSHKKPFPCEICGKIFKQKSLLERHNLVHSGEKPFSCKICGKRYASKYMLIIHMHNHTATGERPYICNICNKRFASQVQLKRHTKIHSTETPYMCEVCGKSFKLSKYLSKHKRVHWKENHICEICGRKFKTSIRLRDHEYRIHTSVKPFDCLTCDEMFSEEKDMQQHVCTHTGEKSHLCETCGKSFLEKSNLQLHKLKHTTVKDYKCRYCGKHFRDWHPRNTHENKHAGKTPYRCDTCGMAFSGYGQLSNHKLKHSTERPFVCNICGKGFVIKERLKRHTQTHFRIK